MTNLTEVINNKRVWTKESTFNILKITYDKRWNPNDLINFLDQGLKEAKFTSKKPRTVLNRIKYSWVLEYGTWRYPVWLWVSPQKADTKVELKMGRESYNDLGDLIYLWDKVRSSWDERQ